MRQIVFALRFRGDARRNGIDGNVLSIATAGPGCTIRSRVVDGGLVAALHQDRRGKATCEADLVLTGETMFQQAGTIAFGTAGHRIRFSTVGSGHLVPAPEADRRHGAAIWRIDGGEGQFAGASGLITSIVVVE